VAFPLVPGAATRPFAWNGPSRAAPGAHLRRPTTQLDFLLPSSDAVRAFPTILPYATIKKSRHPARRHERKGSHLLGQGDIQELMAQLGFTGANDDFLVWLHSHYEDRQGLLPLLRDNLFGYDGSDGQFLGILLHLHAESVSATVQLDAGRSRDPSGFVRWLIDRHVEELLGVSGYRRHSGVSDPDTQWTVICEYELPESYNPVCVDTFGVLTEDEAKRLVPIAVAWLASKDHLPPDTRIRAVAWAEAGPLVRHEEP